MTKELKLDYYINNFGWNLQVWTYEDAIKRNSI